MHVRWIDRFSKLKMTSQKVYIYMYLCYHSVGTLRCRFELLFPSIHYCFLKNWITFEVGRYFVTEFPELRNFETFPKGYGLAIKILWPKMNKKFEDNIFYCYSCNFVRKTNFCVFGFFTSIHHMHRKFIFQNR